MRKADDCFKPKTVSDFIGKENQYGSKRPSHPLHRPNFPGQFLRGINRGRVNRGMARELTHHLNGHAVNQRLAHKGVAHPGPSVRFVTGTPHEIEHSLDLFFLDYGFLRSRNLKRRGNEEQTALIYRRVF